MVLWMEKQQQEETGVVVTDAYSVRGTWQVTRTLQLGTVTVLTQQLDELRFADVLFPKHLTSSVAQPGFELWI